MEHTWVEEEEKEEEEEEEEMRSAVPSLKELCLLVIIEHLDYVEDIGDIDSDLAYEIFHHATWEQLRRIENASKGRDFSAITDGLWRTWFEKKWGRECRQDVEERMEEEGYGFGWRHIFEEKLRLDEEQQQEGVARLRELYMEAHSAKRVRSLQVCDKLPPGGRKKTYWSSSSAGSSGRCSIPKVGERGRLLKKAKIETQLSKEALSRREKERDSESARHQQRSFVSHSLQSSMSRHANAVKMQKQIAESLQIPSFAKLKASDSAGAGKVTLPSVSSKRPSFQELSVKQLPAPLQKKDLPKRLDSPVSRGEPSWTLFPRRPVLSTASKETPKLKAISREGITSPPPPLHQSGKSTVQASPHARREGTNLKASPLCRDGVKKSVLSPAEGHRASSSRPGGALTDSMKVVSQKSSSSSAQPCIPGLSPKASTPGPRLSSKQQVLGVLPKLQGVTQGGGMLAKPLQVQTGAKSDGLAPPAKLQRVGTPTKSHGVVASAMLRDGELSGKAQGLRPASQQQQSTFPPSKQHGFGIAPKQPRVVRAAAGSSRK